MRIENIKSTLLVLLILIIASFACLAVAEEKSTATSSIFTDEASIVSDGNLTVDMAKKIADATVGKGAEDPGVSTEQLQSIIEAAINQNTEEEATPDIDIATLKIKKQDYQGLSAKKIKEKEKEDFVKYIASLYYIFASNSPQPITSSSDMSKAIASTTESIVYAISKESPQAVRDLSASGEKISQQLRELETPEKLLDLHIKAIAYADHTKLLQKYIAPTTSDPVKKLVNLGKLQGFIESLSSFSEEINSRMDEYGVTYEDKDIQDKLKKLGLPELVDTSVDGAATTVTKETTKTTDVAE
jgi:hypothetical protein